MNSPATAFRPVMAAAWVAALICAAPVRAEEADATERSVLGGSPPIYASVPVTSLVTQSYKRFRVVPRGDAPVATEQTGTRCATRLGLFGPGRSLPVNTYCVGRDPQNQLAKGRVVPDGNGIYCATSAGLFGPGPEQPIGMTCSAETKSGVVQGRIAVAE
jgi:hypothetical protein